MNGLEALEALKNGHTVAHVRGGQIDRFYRYCTKYFDLGENVIGLHNSSHKDLWLRWKSEWVWQKCDTSILFWMVAEDDEFVISDGVE